MDCRASKKSNKVLEPSLCCPPPSPIFTMEPPLRRMLLGPVEGMQGKGKALRKRKLGGCFCLPDPKAS